MDQVFEYDSLWKQREYTSRKFTSSQHTQNLTIERTEKQPVCVRIVRMKITLSMWNKLFQALLINELKGLDFHVYNPASGDYDM